MDFSDTQSRSDEQGNINITVHHQNNAHSISLPYGSTLQDLSDVLSEKLSIPSQNQKLLISPKPGLQKPPFHPTSLSSLPLDSPRAKITLLGSTSREIESLKRPVSSSPVRKSIIKPAKPSTRSTQPSSSSHYTFHKLLPLPYLPNPERSYNFLARLRDDPGIRTAMARHRFSIPLLTEMDPAQHTTMSSRTLGLNRNKGEVIELRLRTDAYDGYRDYRTIRKTLCHELAHCEFSDHDRDFWNLTGQIEKEVERADYWGNKGRSVSDQEFYNPVDWEDMNAQGVVDHGGWTGGEFVLGGLSGESSETPSTSSQKGLSRREILANAAEARMAKMKSPDHSEDNSDNRDAGNP
ncbi:ubiquitin/metalloprotease fusion protein [Nannizzia gypsea CBS 118893]|uniref:Ubiquitin/metalloprotease fusion protein n=1 Tax=Arthroderma gypseum (strain ATCC MYA-4604 / CBS 118893) TaxID=535722 RepID=E5R3H8_ARTGP|nr:ubiquitin/metalloprotease fusion protein [Nannizzia gypsea CBS 118893]EFQ98777.1 ubiquitin/metalloprotease fusion protein [Nannizzia gypsea CBS 118893]